MSPVCIFGPFEGYKKALDIVTAFKYFGELGNIWKVPFRNMSAPLPHFVDNGYYDMYGAVRALREVNFDGIVIGGPPGPGGLHRRLDPCHDRPRQRRGRRQKGLTPNNPPYRQWTLQRRLPVYLQARYRA